MKTLLASVLALLLVLSFKSVAELEESGATSKIIGGTPVISQSYPWMVSLQKRDFFTNQRGVILGEYFWHFCGGFQISSQWLITAAHCFYDTGFSADEVIAVIGELDVLDPSESKRQRIDQVIVHPGYDLLARWDQDIALVHLSSANELTNYANIASEAYTEGLSHGEILTVMGWGYTDNDFSEPDTLLEASIPFVQQEACVWGDSYLTDKMLCAGGDGFTDACPGDSGGPLFNSRDEDQVVGLVSWGSEECAQQGRPSVFTRVASYTAWIQNLMQGLAISSPNDFGIWPNGFSQTQSVSVTHHVEGVAPIVIHSVSLSDRAFFLDSDACSGHTLEPGESCELTLSFMAGDYQDESATLVIQSSTGELQAELKGRAAQTLVLDTFPLAEELVLTTVDSEPFGLAPQGGELVATVWQDSEEILFFIQAEVKGTLSLSLSTKGGEEQYLLMRTDEGYLFDSREGVLAQETISYSVEQGELIRFSYTGANSNEDERDALTIHEISFVAAGSGNNNDSSSDDSDTGGSGGGTLHWLWLALLAGGGICRQNRKGFGWLA